MMTPPAAGLVLATRRELLDPHARVLLDVVAARGHRHWMLWVYHSGRYQLRIGIGAAMFGFTAGALRRIDPPSPDGPARHINGAARDLIRAKHGTKQSLAARGVTWVPEGRRFAADAVEAALAYAASLGGPVVVKPDRGSQGLNVAIDLTEPAAIRRAFLHAAAGRGGDAVVVERSLSGEMFRFFYAAPRVAGIRISRPPSVIGDGATSIAGLVAAKNAERLRRDAPGHYPIPLGAEVDAYLARSGRTRDSVPAAGEWVTLRLLPNASVGGDFVNVARDAFDSSYIARVEDTCARLGLMVAGLDTIIADRAQPASAATFAILEINNAPGIVTYAKPWEGPPYDVAGALVDLMERLAAETA